MQAIFLPVMAIAFSAAPIAGQNFGAKQPARVRETLRSAALISSVLMLLLTLICQWRPELFIHLFTSEPAVVAVGAQFLRIISWNFVAQGIIFTCSGMFQAMGNTWPAMLSTATRMVTFVIPALWLSHQPDFKIEYVWYLSVATVTLQAITSLLLVRGQLNKRLKFDADVEVASAG
jgi:Na+-driven multidrug efflux pump